MDAVLTQIAQSACQKTGNVIYCTKQGGGNLETTKLKAYADAHWEGDRYRAIYELLHSGQENVFDEYVDELTQEEADFAFTVVRTGTVRAMGGEENFRKQLKAEQLAIKLNTDTQTVAAAKHNPYRKSLWLCLALLVAAIVLPPLLASLFADRDWLYVVQAIAIGLAAGECAEQLLRTLCWRKIRRLLATIPAAPEALTPPTYQECLDAYREILRSHKPVKPTQLEEVTATLDRAKRQNLLALAWLPVYIIAILPVAALAMKGGIVGGVVGFAAMLGCFLLVCHRCFTRVLATRDALNGLPRDTQGYEKLNTRQSLCVLAMLCLLGLYLIVAFVGCGMCISFMVT